MLKKLLTALLVAAAGTVFAFAGTGKPCAHVYGKIRVVSIGEDYKVRVVNIGEDLRVRVVSIAPDSPGKWEFVDIGEDFKIRFVDIGEDFTIRFVNIAEGPAQKPASSPRERRGEPPPSKFRPHRR